MFINIEADYKDFLEYANKMGIHPWVRAFIGKNPAYLHKFEVGANAFPSPRSWERTSELLKMGHAPHILTECLYGQIGSGMTSMFMAYMKVADRLPGVEDVIRNPESVPVFDSNDADILYMLIANLVEVSDKKNLGQVLKYLKRLPNKEFVAMWAKDVQTRHPEVNDTKEMTEFKLSVLTKILI
jgi:hypothetical protein